MRVCLIHVVPILLILTLKIFPQDSINQGNSFSIYIENEFAEKYIFRGITLHDKFTAQPAFYLWYGNSEKSGMFGAGVWLNANLPYKQVISAESKPEGTIDRNEPNTIPQPVRLTELDIYFMYEKCIDKIYLKISLAVYTFSEYTGFQNTAEYILNVSYSFKELNLYSEIGCDIYANPGAYVLTHGISYEKNIVNDFYAGIQLNIIWSGALYSNVNYGIDKSLLNCTVIEGSISYYPSEGFYTKFHWQYNEFISRQLRTNYSKSTSYFGFITGFTF